MRVGRHRTDRKAGDMVRRKNHIAYKFGRTGVKALLTGFQRISKKSIKARTGQAGASVKNVRHMFV